MTVSVNPSVNGGAQASQSSQGGTVTNTGGSLTSNDVLLGAGGDDLKRVPGLSSDGTSKFKAGVAGSSVGGVQMHNATSGSVTIQPVTGALGTRTLLAPAADGTLATTDDISDAIDSIQLKPAVRVATTAAGTFATAFDNGSTVDGVVLATGDPILIKNQADATQNGPWLVPASGSPTTRMTGSDTGAEILNAVVGVLEGTANAGTEWQCTTPGPITLGSDNITFEQRFINAVPIETDDIWDAKGDLLVGTGADAAAILSAGTDGHVLTLDSAEATGVKWAAPAAGGGVTNSTAAAILALASGDEGDIHRATSSSGDVVEDGYYVWNENLGELQQLVAVTPAEAVAISDGYQGLKTLAAMLALTAVTGMTCSVSDLGNMVSYWRYNGTYWVPFGGRQQIFSLLADTYEATADGTARIVTGCNVTLPAGLLAYDGAGIEARYAAEKLAASAESPTLTLRCGTAQTTSDATLQTSTATAGSTLTLGLHPSMARTAATGLRMKGSGNNAASTYRYGNNPNQARPAAVTVGDWGSAANYLTLWSQRTGAFAEYLVVNTFDVWLTGR